MEDKCIGQVILDLITRCNATPEICERLRVANEHDVEYEELSGTWVVTLRGYHVNDSSKRFKLPMYFNAIEGYVNEDVLYSNVLYELKRLLEVSWRSVADEASSRIEANHHIRIFNMRVGVQDDIENNVQFVRLVFQFCNGNKVRTGTVVHSRSSNAAVDIDKIEEQVLNVIRTSVE